MRSGIYRGLIRWQLWCSLPSSSGKVGRQYAASPAGVVKIDWRLVYPPHGRSMATMPEQITQADQPSSRRNEQELRDARFAMRLSLIVGLAMLIGKTTVYFMTHSAAIFSDATESVVHVVAVGFASFSLRLSTRSASPQFLYGYERITFFSAGFEGAMIVVAAIAILYESIRKWIAGLQLEHLGAGTLLILMAGILNAVLGYYLLRTGRRTHSLILEANGKHVLTDSWTSFGVGGRIWPLMF